MIEGDCREGRSQKVSPKGGHLRQVKRGGIKYICISGERRNDSTAIHRLWMYLFVTFTFVCGASSEPIVVCLKLFE